jgi:hypothetical protein
MRLFDEIVEMVALFFIHLGLRMAKMVFLWAFLMVKDQLPCSFGDLTSQYYDFPSLKSTQVIGMRLFHKKMELMAVFLHFGPINGPKMAKNGPNMVQNG